MVGLSSAMIWLIMVACLLLILLVGSGNATGSDPHKYSVGDLLAVKVKSLTSNKGEMMPSLSYYTLPFCRPQEGIKGSATENLGELLMDDQIENSPLQFKMFTNDTGILLCRTDPIKGDELNLLKKRIDEMYQVNLILDNFPAVVRYPVGIRVGDDAYYLFNHLKFTVLVHKYEETMPGYYMVVGFKVVPCSLQHDDAEWIKDMKMYGKYPAEIMCDPMLAVAAVIRENQTLVFTYEVVFVERSNVIKWLPPSSRWGAYLKMNGTKIHWFSILSSLILIPFFAFVVFLIFHMTSRRDLVRYQALDMEAQTQIKAEFSGLKAVAGDVLRAPTCPFLLCIMVGEGVRILVMAIVAIILIATPLGFIMSSSLVISGSVLLFFFYLVLGIVAGYVAVRLWKTIKVGDHSGWVSVSLLVVCLLPGIA